MAARDGHAMKKADEKAIAEADRKPWWKKLLWLLAIWTASVLALTVVAGLMRLLMNAAGLTTPQ